MKIRHFQIILNQLLPTVSVFIPSAADSDLFKCLGVNINSEFKYSPHEVSKYSVNVIFYDQISMCITDALQGNTATPALPAEVKVRSEAALTWVHSEVTWIRPNPASRNSRI